MADSSTKNPYPFHVCTMEGVFHSGHMTLDQAESAAKDANARAFEMGVSARYAAGAAPEPAI